VALHNQNFRPKFFHRPSQIRFFNKSPTSVFITNTRISHHAIQYRIAFHRSRDKTIVSASRSPTSVMMRSNLKNSILPTNSYREFWVIRIWVISMTLWKLQRVIVSIYSLAEFLRSGTSQSKFSTKNFSPTKSDILKVRRWL